MGKSIIFSDACEQRIFADFDSVICQGDGIVGVESIHDLIAGFTAVLMNLRSATVSQAALNMAGLSTQGPGPLKSSGFGEQNISIL